MYSMAIIALVAVIGFGAAGCAEPTDSAHEHQWGEWEGTAAPTITDDGTETKICKNDNTHTDGTRTLYATGTLGLAFEFISGNTAYRVSKGTVESGEVHTLPE